VHQWIAAVAEKTLSLAIGLGVGIGLIVFLLIVVIIAVSLSAKKREQRRSAYLLIVKPRVHQGNMLPGVNAA